MLRKLLNQANDAYLIGVSGEDIRILRNQFYAVSFMGGRSATKRCRLILTASPGISEAVAERISTCLH